MAEKKNLPEIRFKGFSEEWEENEFSLMVTRVSYISGKIGLPRVEYADIISGKGELNKNIYQKNSSKIGIEFNNGDILYGKLRPYLKNWLLSSFNGIAVGDFWVLRANETNNKFIYYLIQTSTYETTANQSIGTKMPRSDWNVVSKTKFYIPTISNEQSQIGTYFKHLDYLITLNQSKYDKLVNVKKAMLEKMFPKKGDDVPEIRFKGFTGAWEKRKLGEMTDYKNGKGHEDRQVAAGKYELINLNSISIDGGLKLSGKFIDETDTTLKINDLVMVLSDVAHGNLLGRVALIPENDRFVLNQRIALLRPNQSQSINPIFLLYNINAHQNYFKAQGVGMSQLNISKNSVENFTLLVPALVEEQSKIGTFFKHLDHLLALQQQELEKLKNIKKACLEKMFV